MRVSVVGLGVEGKKAVKSLQKHECKVYATDLNKDISIDVPGVDLELGKHDFDKIFSSDAVVISPGLWNTSLASEVRESRKLLSDVIDAHRSIYTIGVTGTNGKTTTSFMIKEVLENAGLRVLMGGNAGGGFEGYTELFLEADINSYDIMIVEVCDMTLDFCKHCFEFDLVVVTNLGRDHMDHHGSMEDYQDHMGKFLKGKSAILNKNDELLCQVASHLENINFYGECDYNSHLFGKFNKLNAGAAQAVGETLHIDEETIKSALEKFNAVEGRIKSYQLKESQVVVGKTDNADATRLVLEEMDFPVICIGTPRKNEPWRLEILDEVFQANPHLLVLFHGLEEDVQGALDKIKCSDFQGEVRIAQNIEEVVKIIIEHSKTGVNIFVGGNGQSKILEIQKMLETL